MARNKASKLDQGSPQISPEQGIPLLNNQIEKGKTLLKSHPLTEDVYDSWELVTRNVLEKAFGANSPNVSMLNSVQK